MRSLKKIETLDDPVKINTIDSVATDLFRVRSTWESTNGVCAIFDVESMNLVTVKNSSVEERTFLKLFISTNIKNQKILEFWMAYKPYGNIIDVYYKIGNSNDVLDFESKHGMAQ